MTMQVLIIEDEQLAAQRLSRLIREIDQNIEVMAVIESVEGATNWLLSHPHPALIFIDVQLEDGLCFEIFERCTIKTPVIFTTAYDEYSLKAFKVNSVDYLLKPISVEELNHAIEKFKSIHHHQVDLTRIESLINQLQPKVKERFLIKIGDHYRSIPVTSINCFFIKERCNFISIGKQKNYAIDLSLDRIEEKIDPRLFFRISRNYIIRYDAIRDIIAYSSSRLKIILSDWDEKDEIVVSRERVGEFKGWMDR